MKELILNEQELVDRCRKKDRHAEEHLYNQLYPILYRIGMRYLSDHQDTQDVAVYTFIRVFNNLKKFRYEGPGSLKRWTGRIMVNESIRFLKKRSLLHFGDDFEFLGVPDLQTTGLDQLQANDLMRLIEKLPTGYRTVFNLFVIEGFSHKEISDMLKISESTSKTQLKKARGQLMKNIEKEGKYGTV